MNTYTKSTYFLFFFIIQFAYSQEYVPFPEDSAVWRESWATGDSGYQTGSGGQQYFLYGDTVINDLEYSFLYDSNYHPFSPHIPFDSIQLSPVGLLREEDKRIYFMNYDSWGDSLILQSERLLYDFNLEVGDTINCFSDHDLAPYVQGYDHAIVGDIDTIQTVDGIYRKRYIVNANPLWFEPYIIEGIGSVDGLFYPCGSDNWHAYNSLICLGIADEIIYGSTNPSNPNCYNLYLNTQETTYQSLTLQPNPTTGIVHLSEPVYDVHLSVYSAIGQKVRDERSFNGSFIDLNGLASGVYFVVMLGDENYLGKVVKE